MDASQPKLALLVSLGVCLLATDVTVLSTFLLLLPVLCWVMVPGRVWRRWSWWITLVATAAIAVWMPMARVVNGWMPETAQIEWRSAIVHAWALAGMAWFPIAAVLTWRAASWMSRAGLAVVGLVLLLVLPNLPWMYRPHWVWPSAVAQHAVVQRTLVTTEGALPLRLWAPDSEPLGVVVLVHGVGSNQDYLASRAELIMNQGWAVLTCDLPGHGMAPCGAVTYGPREADALVAVYRNRGQLVDPKLPAVVYGMSMGGAIAALAIDRCLDARGLIIESGYADLGAMIDEVLDPVIAQCARLVSILGIGIDPRQVRPMDAMWIQQDRPLLVGWGTADGVVGAHHSRAFVTAAPSARWCEVPGAVHDELIERRVWREAVSQALGDWLPASTP